MALSHVMNIISNAGAVSAGTGSGSGGGGSSNLDSQTVTVGSSTSASGGSGAPAGTTVRRGYSGIYSIGSVSDGTSNLYSGALFSEIQYTWDTIYPISAFTLRIVGASRANSGWTTLTIGTTSYQRSSAQYAPDAGGDTYWTWFAGTDNTGAGNPFSGTGTTTNCVFT